MWFVLFFVFFMTVNSESIHITNMRQNKSIVFDTIRQLFFDDNKLEILKHIKLKTSEVSIKINRNRVQDTFKNVLETITEIDRQLLDGIYTYFESILHKYNKLLFEYLMKYYNLPVLSSSILDVILFKTLIPYDVIHKNSLFTLLNTAEMDVGALYDNLLIYTTRSMVQGTSTEISISFMNYIKQYTFDYSYKKISNISSYRDTRKYTISNLLSLEITLNILLNVFSDFSIPLLRQSPLAIKSFTKVEDLMMYMYNQMKCNVKIKSSKVTSHIKNVEKWFCGPDLEKQDYGFMTYTRGTIKRTVKPFTSMMDKTNDGGLSQVWTQTSLPKFNKPSHKKLSLIKESLGESLNELMITNDEYHYEYFQISLQELENWVKINSNTNNMLTLKHIKLDLLIHTAGLISGRLFQGAEYILYIYCQNLEKSENALASTRNIRFLRTYLILFRLLLKEMIKIFKNYTLNVLNNIYLIHTEENITKMIDLTLMSRYDGENDFLKIQKMKIYLTEEYGEFQMIVSPASHIDDWNVKKDYFMSPIIWFNKILNLMFFLMK